MLKTIGVESLIRDLVPVGKDSIVNEIDRGNNEIRAKLKARKNSAKSKNIIKLIELSSRLGFLTSGTKLAFIKLRQVFIKALIFLYFDLKCHICIKINTSGYAIGGVLSYLTSDDLGRWHSRAFFSWKMILVKTQYEIHNGKLLAIVKAFNTW